MAEVQSSLNRNIRSSGSAATTLPVCCEILPVTLVAGRLYYLRSQHELPERAWHVAYQSGMHPSSSVRNLVEEALGSVLVPQRWIVHSTAWRYDRDYRGEPQLLLTYLVAIHSWPSVIPSAIEHHWRLEPICAVQVARSGTLTPPDQIVLSNVLAHALDHLALLFETDHTIARALGSAWYMALADRTKRPAGEYLSHPHFATA